MPCRHHWVIEPPEEPMSAGVCLHCGASRQFANSVEEAVKSHLTASARIGSATTAVRTRKEPVFKERQCPACGDQFVTLVVGSRKGNKTCGSPICVRWREKTTNDK